MKKGVGRNRIKSLGIPFDPQFNEPLNKNELFQKLKLNPDIPTVLIMGGGQGLGPIKTIVKSLEKVKREIQEIVVCGANKKLYKSLKRRIKKYKKEISLFRYALNINELMRMSDIIITKPGGVTTAEVLANHLPMVIVKPLPGQEANNASYLIEKGAAIKVDKPRQVNLAVENLLANPVKLKEMSEATRRITKPNASLDIAKLLLNEATT
jgi:processive 1,2-diacylglycerol beta-glucosyltransferase